MCEESHSPMKYGTGQSLAVLGIHNIMPIRVVALGGIPIIYQSRKGFHSLETAIGKRPVLLMSLCLLKIVSLSILGMMIQ